MQKTQLEQYDMLLAVENHFDDNATSWNFNKPITDAKKQLSAKLDEIATEVGIQLSNPTGITKDKAIIRKGLEHEGFVLSSILSGYAAMVPAKKEMYKRVRFTKTQFLQFRESELIGVITNLHEEALVELSNLSPYGVSASTLSELLAANNAFRAIMKKPQAAISKRRSATERIKVLLPEMMSVVETQMDNLIVMLEASQPQFVAVYFNVRSIRSRGNRTLSLAITTLDAKTNKPLANAKLEIAGKGISRISGKRGYNRIQNLNAGSHQLMVSHPSRGSKTIPFTIVSGETTELVIALEGE